MSADGRNRTTSQAVLSDIMQAMAISKIKKSKEYKSIAEGNSGMWNNPGDGERVKGWSNNCLSADTVESNELSIS